MSLVGRLFERRDLIGPLHPRDPALAEIFGVRPAAAGIDISERTVLSWTALTSGIRLLAETVGWLPLDVCRHLQPRGRQVLRDHWAAMLLDFPNPEITTIEFKELIQQHAIWWGNGYAQIVYNGRGLPMELWPLNPDRVSVFRDQYGALKYRVGLPNEPFGAQAVSVVLPAEEVLHIRGFSRYGIIGDRMSVTFREAIGLGLATELFGSLFFGQGANAGGFLEHPGTLTAEAQARLKKAKEDQIGGISRSHRLMVLEEGMKFNQTMIEPEKAQFLLTRQFQVIEAARILRIPPHMLYDLERGTFSNIEQQETEFVTFSLMPWLVRWEQRLRLQLLGLKDFGSTYFKFRVNALLRGDTSARGTFYQQGIQNGWFSQNDVRQLEDENPIDGGDTYRVLSTLQPVTTPKPDTGAGVAAGGAT